MSDRMNCSAITSMNPNPLRAERQLLCIRSWLDAGLRVVVVNTADELSSMSLPEGVHTVACDDLTTLYDRKTQLVSSLIRVGIETGGVFMLINSDIEINGDLSLLDEAMKHPDELTIGIRYNHQSWQKAHPVLETSGLDVFIMTPELAATLPAAPFGIGKPVWDYWIPHHFRSLGITFNWIRRRLFLHETHELGWSWQEWQQGADYIHQEYGVVLGYGSAEFRLSLDKNVRTVEPVASTGGTCQCELSGFCSVRNIAIKRTYQMICRENKPRLDAILAGETWTQTKATAGPQRQSCSTKKSKCNNCSDAGTLMLRAIETDTGQPVTCGSCKTYLMSLNRMSAHDHEAIVKKLYAEISWPQSWRVTHGDRDGQRKRIGEIVSGVLAIATTTCKVVRPQRPPRETANRKSIPEVSRKPMDQIARRPFTAKPRLTLLFHCWPNGDSWKRHVDYLRPVSGVFERKIMGVATGPGTATLTEVQAAFGDSWEYLEVTNDKALREVLTYRTMLEMVRSTDENDVTFCLHSKGAQSHTAASRQIQWWTEAMYQTVVHNWKNVLGKMEQGYPVAGSFLRVGKHLQARYGWHFSGTFYAFRNAVAFQNGVPGLASNFYGTESWPGHHFARHEAACMFAENCGDIYKENPQLELELNEWRRLNET